LSKIGLNFTSGESHDQADAEWIVIRTQLTPNDIPFLKNETGRNKTKQNFVKVGTFQKLPVLRVDITKYGETEGILFHSVNGLSNERGTLDRFDYLK
jgi:hypothetical protein